MKITVETTVNAPVDEVWRAWNTPDDINRWNTASDDWHTVNAAVDLQVGGTFSSRMEAKDGSMGFDFAGTYTAIEEQTLIEYVMDDKRVVRTEFMTGDDGVTVRQTFDAEPTNPEEHQRNGWQAILNNFAKYVEGN